MKRQDRSRLAGMMLAILACGAFAAAQQTQPAATQPAKTQKHEPPAGTQKLIQRIVKSAKDDADAAARLVAAAKALQDDPKVQVAVCQKAYEYGIKAVDGLGFALDALDILDKADTGRAGIWAKKRIKVYRLGYAAAGGKDKQGYGRSLVRMLARMGDEKAKGGKAKEAADFYRQALALANRLRLGEREEISAKLIAAVGLLRLHGVMDRLKAKLTANPADKATRESLIHMYLVRLDSPGEAAKYLSDDCDERLRTCVPLAAKPLAELEDTECLEVARWYRLLPARTAATEGKIRMLEKARSYLGRYLAVHSGKDADRTGAILLLKQVDAAIAKLGGLTLPKGAVLVLTFESNTLFTKSGLKYIRDLSGKGHDGRITGGAIVPGKAGSAMKFDKKTHVNLGNPEGLRITGGQTICMWIKAADLASRQNPINKAYGGEGTWTLEKSGTINYWYGSSGANRKPFKGYNMSKPLAAGTWAHVASVRDMKARKVTWYKDGAFVSSASAKHTPAASSSDLLIGKGYTTGMSGLLDEVAVFNRALSAEDIKAIYECGKQGRPLAR